MVTIDFWFKMGKAAHHPLDAHYASVDVRFHFGNIFCKGEVM
jgi:hypothetical protein